MANKLRRASVVLALVAALLLAVGAGTASAASWGSFETDASWGE